MKAKITNSLLNSVSPSDKPFEVCDTELKGFILRVQPSGVKSFKVRFRYNGKQSTKTIGTYPAFKPTKARKEAERILSELKLGKSPTEEIPPTDLTLRDYIDAKDGKYGIWAIANHSDGKATIARITSSFDCLLDIKLSEIKTWEIEDWRAGRVKSGTKPSTINRDLTALKSLFSKALEWGVLNANPAAKIKRSKVDKEGIVRFLSEKEEKALRNALEVREEFKRSERDRHNRFRKQRKLKPYPNLRKQPFVDHLKPMVLLTMNTGIRRNELFNLSCHDIDFKKKIMTVRGGSSKSGSTRRINLNSEALNTAEKWIAQTKATKLLFPNSEGKPFDNINKSWKGLMKLAKISDFRFHDLRHHFASKLVMKGVALNTVRELLGHSDLTMTLRYAHLAEEHKAEAVAKLLD